MTSSEKKHITALRILEVLKILLKEDLKKTDLILKLKENSKVENVYTYEAFIKYFNTLELAGFKIEKEKNKYKLLKALLKLDLSEEEEKVFYKIISNIGLLNNRVQEDIIKKVILKLDKYTDLNLEQHLKETLLKDNLIHNTNVKKNIAATIKNMIYENFEVDITYKKSDGTCEKETVVLKSLLEKDSNIFVIFYNPKRARNKKINIDSIVSLNQLHSKASNNNVLLNSVVFEIYGRLSASYRLKPGESTMNFNNNYMSISNRGEDRDSVMHRLLKYGENCKIIKPDDLKEDFIKLTDEMLKNLES